MFYLGLITEKYKFYRKMSLPWLVRFIVALLAFAFGAFLIYQPIHGVLFIQWIPPYLIFLMVYKWGQNGKANNGKRYKALMFFDKYSMPIYIIHHILIFALLVYVPFVSAFWEEHFVCGPLVMFCFITPVSLLFSYVLGFIPGAEYCIGISNKSKK